MMKKNICGPLGSNVRLSLPVRAQPQIYILKSYKSGIGIVSNKEKYFRDRIHLLRNSSKEIDFILSRKEK
jgi:hypothetical protein